MAETVTRTTISISPDIMKDAKLRLKALGYANFSEYVTYLINHDVVERPDHVTIRTEGSTSYRKTQRGHGGSILNESPSKPSASRAA